MSARLNSDGQAEIDLKSPLREELKAPTNEEVAACRPCRLALVVIFTLVLLAMLVSAIVVIATSKKCGKPIQRAEFWRKETFYQIYVPSFKDTSSDGYGDLKGVVSKLAYLEGIGVKILVLSGLVSQSSFNQLRRKEDQNEFENLVKEAKNRKISIVLEIDPTYADASSSAFQTSQKSKGNLRDWFLWKDWRNSPAGTENNWQSKAGGKAWKFDAATNESYYFYQGEDKPVLNYNNSLVKEEFKNALKIWLDKGVKGFKLNNFQRLIVDKDLRNNPAGQTKYDKDMPATHNLLKEFHTLVASKDGFLMGALEKREDSAKTESYFGPEKGRELDLVMNSHFTESPIGNPGEFFNSTVSNYLKSVPRFSWPSWVFDGPEYNERLGKRYISQKELVWLCNMLHLTLPGSPVFYYGDELGLRESVTEAMAWDGTRNGGFSDKNPWYSKSAPVTQITNVEDQMKTNESFAIFKNVNGLRIKEAALQGSKLQVWHAKGDVVIFRRFESGYKSFVIALNFGGNKQTISDKNVGANKGFVVSDTKFTLINRELNLKTIVLDAFQGLIMEVSS